MANTPDTSKMSDDERADLMAMIAAGRDLSPDMDKSLVESYAERRKSEQQAKAKVQGNTSIVPQQSGGVVAGQHPAVAIVGMVTLAAIFITIMLVTGGHGWWLIFPLFGIFGGVWGNNDRRRIRTQQRAERYQMRADYYRARNGLPPREDAQRLPEAQQPTQPSQPSQRDSAPLPPPSTYSAPPVQDTQPPVNPAG